jgi:thioredoxin reductase (NADPH)
MRYGKIFIGSSLLLSVLIVSFQFMTDSGLSAGAMARMKLDDQTYPVIIIGGGIGGLTAALYCGQAKMPSLVLQGPKPGGALAQSHSVRNWPGVLDAPGADIVSQVREQAVRAGAVVTEEKAIAVDFKQWPYQIELASVADASTRRLVKALTVIIATGTEPNLLGIPGETGPDGYWGRGVSNCAVCEGSLFAGKDVLIVGGGDAAMVEAGYLSAIAKTVTVAVRKDALRAKDITARDQVLAKPNVTVLYSTQLREIMGNGQRVTEVKLLSDETYSTHTVPMDGVFLAIGSKPNTALFSDQLELDSAGFIKRQQYQQTSRPGVFAVGDVCDGTFVQAVTASGDGCRAALQAIALLKSIGFDPVRAQAAAQLPAPVPEIVSEQQPVASVLEVATEADLQDVVMHSSLPVVLDMYATWCQPCQAMAPVLERLASRYAGKLIIAKLNIQNKTLSVDAVLQKLRSAPVQSVPTFLLIKNGIEIGRLQGSRSEAVFITALEKTFGAL